MKYLDPAYWTMMSIALINWLLSTVDIVSKLSAVVIAIITIAYLWEKLKGQKLDNEIKRKELEDDEK